MTNDSDSVPQREQAPDFFLWLPNYQDDEGGSRCAVDITPASGELLESGTDDLAHGLVAALGLTSAPIESWTLEGFNTTFYARDIDGDDPSDYLSPAWRLRLELKEWGGPRPESQVGPIPFWGYDETWFQNRPAWDFSAHETVVIALSGPEPDLVAFDALRPRRQIEIVQYQDPRFTVNQLRVSLGVVPLPEAEDEVFDVVDVCHRQAMLIHEQSAHGLFTG